MMPALDVVRDEVDADAVIPDDDKPDRDAAFVCKACGESFASQRGLNVHAGHAHPDHPELQVKSTRRRTTTRKTDYKKPESTDEKIAKWQRFIEQDVNNWLLIGATTPLVGIPAAALPIKPPALGGATVADRIRFSQTEAHVLARTITSVEQNPQAAQLIASVSSLLPYALIIASVGIVAIHTYGVWRLRSELPEMMRALAAPQKSEQSNGKQPSAAQSPTKPQFALI